MHVSLVLARKRAILSLAILVRWWARSFMMIALALRRAASRTQISFSLTYNGGAADNGSAAAVSSSDGNHVVFISIADNLLPHAYRSSAVYVRMTCTNATAGCVPTTYLLSLDSNTGIQGNTSYSDYPAITPDGQYAVFISDGANWPGSLQSNGKNQVWLARVF